MNVLYAPDAYSGFVSAPDAVERFEQIAAEAGLFATGHPMSNGGDGLIDVLRAHGPVDLHGFEVSGPHGDMVFATAARRKGVWWIEAAEVIGHKLTEESGMDASSYGLGELLKRVAHTAPGPIMMGLGDTATIDGGLGMLQALGFNLRDQAQRTISTPATARDLSRLSRIDGSPQIPGALIRVLCDVTTPLPMAPEAYSGQSRLSDADVIHCASGLSALASILQLDPETPGGGAGGGIGFTLASVLRAGLSPGAELMAKVTDLSHAIDEADVVITGMSTLDDLSFSGSVAGEVQRRARAAGCPVHALVRQATGASDDFVSIQQFDEDTTSAFDAAARGLCSVVTSTQW